MTLHENITTFSYTVAAPREGVEQSKGEKGETHPTCFSQKPPRGLRLSRQDSNNFSHKVEDLMNTVFPLMPWKNYTQKKKRERQKNSDFLHIYKNKPPDLTTREVEQLVMGYGKGSLPDQQFLKGSHPAARRKARLSLPEQTRGTPCARVGPEPLSSSAAWCPGDPWG